MGDDGEPPAGARISRGPQGPEIVVSQNARKFKDKDNLGGVPKIKKIEIYTESLVSLMTLMTYAKEGQTPPNDQE